MDLAITDIAVDVLFFAAGLVTGVWLCMRWFEADSPPQKRGHQPIIRCIAGYELKIQLQEDGLAVFPTPAPPRADASGDLWLAKGMKHIAIYRQSQRPVVKHTDALARLGPHTWLVGAAEQLPRDGHPVHHWTAADFSNRV